MKKIECILCLYFCYILTSCTEHRSTEINDTPNWTPVGNVVIHIDSLTSTFSSYLDIYHENGNEYLGLLNGPENAIQVYELNNGNLKNKLQLPQEGPNGVGKIEGFKFTKDSIWIASKMNLMVINKERQILHKYEYPFSASIEANPIPQVRVSSNRPIAILDGKIYLSSALLGYYKHQPLVVFDIKNEKFDFKLSFPEKYHQGIWGAMNYDYFYHCVNSEQKNVVISFAASENLLVYNGQNEGKKNAKSISFDNIEAPFSSKEEVASMSPEEYSWVFVSSPSYYGVLFDTYRRVYYRFAWHGVSDNLKGMPITEWKSKESVIILDENFNRINEFLLPANRKYRTAMSVVSEKGLLIPYENEDSEDEIIFDVFLYN